MSEKELRKPDDGRLIDYLLNESSPEESLEIERLCAEHSEWNDAKEHLGRTLGLLEDACKQPFEKIEKDMSLDPDRIKNLKSIVEENGEGEKKSENYSLEAEPIQRKLLSSPIFWGPLAAAACAAFLAGYPSLFDEPESEEVALTYEGDKDFDTITKANLQAADLAQEISESKKSADSVGISQNSPVLKKVEVDKIMTDVDEQLIALSSLEAESILSDRTQKEVVALNDLIEADAREINLAEAFSTPVPPVPLTSSKEKNPASDSFLAAVPPAPMKNEQLLLPSPKPEGKAKSQIAYKSATPPVILGKEAELAPIREEESVEEILRTKPKGFEPEIASLTAPEQKDLGLMSRSRKSAVAEKVPGSALNFSSEILANRRARPSSWTTLFRQPGPCLLFTEDGEALGLVESSQAVGNKCNLRRVRDIRQGKRFTLSPGAFQLRYTSPRGSVVILSGALDKKTSERGFEGTYEFTAEKAWWLDQNEVRQALPIEELSR
jgi:hypothetical protein